MFQIQRCCQIVKILDEMQDVEERSRKLTFHLDLYKELIEFYGKKYSADLENHVRYFEGVYKRNFWNHEIRVAVREAIGSTKLEIANSRKYAEEMKFEFEELKKYVPAKAIPEVVRKDVDANEEKVVKI